VNGGNNPMTKIAFKPGEAAHAVTAGPVEGDEALVNVLVPEVALPLEGLTPEEADVSIRAVDFLCILVEFYEALHAEVAAPSSALQEYRSTLLAY
jgi:hypothetical protein